MDISNEIGSLKASHEPSYSRSLVRIAKRAVNEGLDLGLIIEAARGMKDPYYIASTLSGVGKLTGDASLFKDAIGIASTVEPQWRRAEIAGRMIKDMVKGGARDLDAAIPVVLGLTETEPRREAVKDLIKGMTRTGSLRMTRLLDSASDPREMVMIVKSSVSGTIKHEGGDLSGIEAGILEVGDPMVRGKSLAYLGSKVYREVPSRGRDLIESALDGITEIEPVEDRLDLLRDVADKLLSIHSKELRKGKIPPEGSAAIIKTLCGKAKVLDGIHDRASYHGYLAGRMSKYGIDGYPVLFEEALAMADGIEEPDIRDRVRRNIAKGMDRSGIELPDDLSSLLKREVEEGEVQCRTTPEPGRTIERDVGDDHVSVGRPRPVLGLYNTYERKLAPAHVRAVARAAPLCIAFDLDLALIGFPFGSNEEVVRRVSADTNVGKGGEYLGQLADQDRLSLYEDINVMGDHTLIATTSHPDGKKLLRISKDAGIPADVVPSGAVYLLGVGKAGLPGSVLARADKHLEFTGKNIPLETGTAMGVLANILKGNPAE